MRYLLAVDAGGTKCQALLTTLAGEVLGQGVCSVDDPESGQAWGGSGRSPESVRTAVRRALGDRRPAALLTAGLGPWPLDSPSPALESVPVQEWEPGLALAGVTAGVVTLAGTGAFVHGSTRDGRQLHLDGLGPRLGDYGSGSQIGELALRAAARADWAPRHATLLRELVCDALGLRVHELVAYAHAPRDRAEIAALARLVDTAAEAGDAVAHGLLTTAADAQAEVVRDVVDGLALADEAYPLVAMGSVATRSRLYWQRLCARVAQFAPQFAPVCPQAPAVVGVALKVLASHGEPGATERLRAGWS